VVPSAFTPQELKNETEYLAVLGKLRIGGSASQANAELSTISQDLIKARSRRTAEKVGWRVYATPMRKTPQARSASPY